MYTFSLVKKDDIHTGKGKIIPAEDFSSLLNANELIEKAKEEAKKLIDDAKISAEKIKEKAKEDGFNEGLIKFNTHTLFLEDQVKTMRHEMQKVILPLVLKATKRIVGDELEVNPESVVNIVMQSIKSVTQCKNVKLFVNKSDLEILEKEKEKIKSLFESLDSFQIEVRSDILPGSCIIETEKGILNATLDNQYRALERAFEAHLKKR